MNIMCSDPLHANIWDHRILIEGLYSRLSIALKTDQTT